MSNVAARFTTPSDAKRAPERLSIRVMGVELTPLQACGLWWADQRLLVVSDLHLEKGSSFAARGQLLPPYDTRATLNAVADMMAELRPETVISLGDSFHDPIAERRLSSEDAAHIRTLTDATDWIWVEGNHDPAPPAALGGRAADEVTLGPLTFRHEPTGGRCDGEIAGHLHPCAKIRGRSGRCVRQKCFVHDDARLVMPAIGAYTGGLNVCDPAFAPIFSNDFEIAVAGRDGIYEVSRARLTPDGPRAGVWRL